jgi:hypothetical protein
MCIFQHRTFIDQLHALLRMVILSNNQTWNKEVDLPWIITQNASHPGVIREVVHLFHFVLLNHPYFSFSRSEGTMLIFCE